VSRPQFDSIIRLLFLVTAMLGVALPLADAVKRVGKTATAAPIDARYSAVASALPPQATLGYVSDLPDRGPGLGLFLQAQYALAPRILLEGDSHRLTLANLQDPAKLAAVCAANGLAPVKVDPDGVALLEKKGAP
jgi:hypothetical protein